MFDLSIITEAPLGGGGGGSRFNTEMTIFHKSYANICIFHMLFDHMTSRASESEVTPCIKIDKPIVVNRFSGYVIK